MRRYTLTIREWVEVIIMGIALGSVGWAFGHAVANGVTL